ncbi:MAG: Rieske (2Fe-2S) protein [Bacteroidetes bacterium]|nr:Rieske (2Fe-2S) protein [Bacteroidota bacterium]
MDRKEFVVTACALCGIGAALSLQSCQKYSPTPVDFTLDLSSSSNAALANTGGYVISNNVFVINTGSGYKAISMVCTHEGCIVSYTGSGFDCGCHGGRFSSDGTRLSGPPPSNLPTYTVTQSGTILTIKG